MCSNILCLYPISNEEFIVNTHSSLVIYREVSTATGEKEWQGKLMSFKFETIVYPMYIIPPSTSEKQESSRVLYKICGLIPDVSRIIVDYLTY